MHIIGILAMMGGVAGIVGGADPITSFVLLLSGLVTIVVVAE